MATRGIRSVGAPAAREAGRAPPAQGAVGAGGAPRIQAPRAGEDEHRGFPRAELAVRFELWRGEGEGRTFSASLRSANVSVSGAFLESSFFLPVGTELQVRFKPEPTAPPVEARAVIVRVEGAGEGGSERAGFGVRFVELLGQTEVTLARLFLDARLRAFARDYLGSRRARTMSDELERVVDALAAWELLKAHGGLDPWLGS